MLESIRNFFQRKIEQDGNGSSGGTEATYKLHIAACALLLELAYADDQFSEAERTHIEAVLQRHFDLDAETAQSLIELRSEERRVGTECRYGTWADA